jgi:predicted RNA binding protein YcfA (HicA-like mRNA interferase family)
LSGLPQVSGPTLIRALQKTGFLVKRQHGSHVILRHATDLSRRAVIPVHGSKAVKPGTLRAILRGAQVTPEQLRDLL